MDRIKKACARFFSSLYLFLFLEVGGGALASVTRHNKRGHCELVRWKQVEGV